MVVFTCGHCGESLQKPRVFKHYQAGKCFNRHPNLSCMDCFQDFHGKEYEVHTKCISEAERYSGKGFVPKQNKGERKQNAWFDMIQGVLDERPNVTPNVIRIVKTISKHGNTPRKKPKFLNFVNSMMGSYTHPDDIEAAWNLISTKLDALSNANATNKSTETKKEDTSETGENQDKSDEKLINGSESEKKKITEQKTKKQLKEEKKQKKYEAELQSAGQVNENQEIPADEKSEKAKKRKIKHQQGVNEDNSENVIDNILEKKDKKNKKRKLDAENHENETPVENGIVAKEKTEKDIQTENNGDKFKWNEVIINLLKSKDNEMPFKRFQKKILAEYTEVTGKEPSERIVEKLHKKLKSTNNVWVDKNRVILKS